MATHLLGWVLGVGLMTAGWLCLWLRRYAPEIKPLLAWGQGAIFASVASIGLAVREPGSSQWRDASLAVPAFLAAAALISGLLVVHSQGRRVSAMLSHYMPALAALLAIIVNLLLAVLAPQSHQAGVCGLLAIFMVAAAKVAWQQSQHTGARLGLPLFLLVPACLALAVSLLAAQAVLVSLGLVTTVFVAVLISWVVAESLIWRMQFASQKDRLTGLLHQAGIEGFLSKHFAHADAEPVVLLKLDIDHLAAVNKQYGRDIGDQVLGQVANVLRVNFRSGDCIARVTGQQFLVACVGLQSDVAQVLAERARQAVSRVVIRLDNGERLSVTISVGVSSRCKTLPACAPGWQQADSALYRAKSLGRNLSIAHWAEPSGSE